MQTNRELAAIDVECNCSSQVPKESARKVKTPQSRQIILISSSEDSDDDSRPRGQKLEVIEITDSSPERSPRRKKITTKKAPRPRLKQPSSIAPERMLPLYVDDEEPWDVDDGSILTL